MNSCLAAPRSEHDSALLPRGGSVAASLHAARFDINAEAAVLSPLHEKKDALSLHVSPPIRRNQGAPCLSPQGLCREYVEWDSPTMGCRMEMLIFGHGGERVLVFPTRRGRFYEYEDGGLIEALRPRIEEGWIQLFCVDGIDGESVYNREVSPWQRMQNHVRYEQYIINEVLPYTAKSNRNPCLIAHGASLGAWHAMNITLRHPHLFHRAVCLSGRYDLTASMPPDFEDLFDGYYDETIYYNTPLHFLPRMEDPVLIEQLRKLDITLVIGEADPFLKNNQNMSRVLTSFSISHALHYWSGRAHRFARWR